MKFHLPLAFIIIFQELSETTFSLNCWCKAVKTQIGITLRINFTFGSDGVRGTNRALIANQISLSPNESSGFYLNQYTPTEHIFFKFAGLVWHDH